MLDEKDLEIARLKGEVAALERILAAMRAQGPSYPLPPLGPSILPTTNPLLPQQPNIFPVYCGPTTTIGAPIPGMNAGCANPLTLGGTVWIGETTGLPGPLTDLCAPGVPLQAFASGVIAPDGVRVGTH